MMKPFWPTLTMALFSICFAFAVLMPAPGRAQLLGTRAQSSARFEFNFSNPGARSLAMGGAFAALADDATAAYTNPAGLTNLSRPEMSLEIRAWDYEVSFLDALSIRESGRSEQVLPVEVRSDSRIEGVSFASVVYPYRRWTFAAYRHQLANFAAEADDFPILPEGSSTTQKLRSTVELQIRGYGLMGAYLLERYGLSLGFGVVSYDASYQAVEIERRTFVTRESILQSRAQSGEGSDWALNLGVRWRPVERIVVGAFYRQGLEFPISDRLESGSAVFKDDIGSFRAPDVYGFGVGTQLMDHLWINAEYSRVAYSQISQNVPPLRGDSFQGKFVRDNADEIRLGLEYSFWSRKIAPAVRMGAWYDPDHALRFEVAPGRERDPSALDAAVRFPAGEDEVHFTAGAGIVVGQRLQIDAGVDFADSRDTGSLSIVLRF